METPRIYDPTLHGDCARVEDYKFNHIAFCDALQHARNADPRFKSVPLEDMAELMGLSRSNFQRLRKGSVPDPKSSTIWLICSALHIPAHKLLGLPAPEPEHGHEDTAAIAAMELHMRDLERRDDINTKELDRLRKLVLEKGEAMSRASEQSRHMEKTIKEQREHLNKLSRHRAVLVILLFVAVALLAYCAYDIAHPNMGFTSLFM